MRQAPPGQRPYIVTDACDAAAVLTAARIAKGWSGEELDAQAGVTDRHSCKLENPDKGWGRRGFLVTNAWSCVAEALGLCLVLMPISQARKLGAIAAPQRKDVVELARYQRTRTAA